MDPKSAISGIVNEHCVTIIKPGVDKATLVCYCLNCGFRPNGSPNGLFQKFMFNEEILREFYPHVANKPYWHEFLSFMTSEECMLGVFRGFNVIESTLKFVGQKTDPKKNPSHTIRGRFGLDIQNNAMHCSRTPEEAKRELAVLKKYGIV